MHQNVWQWVNGLCPDPCGVHEREGKKEDWRRERGGLRPGPPRFRTDRRHC